VKRLILGLCLALIAIPATAQQLNISVVPVVSASAEKGHVLKATAGHLYSAYATNVTATAGFLVLIDAAAVPTDGAITPIACIPLPASGAASFNYSPSPPGQFSTGIVAAATSASSCFTLTTGTITAFFSGLVQ
jgi:hypothetical protein